MSKFDPTSGFKFEEWVGESVEHKTFRQAVHTILYAIAGTSDLRSVMTMKGGILLALNYESTRYTKDIDFSSDLKIQDIDVGALIQKFDSALVAAVENLQYDIDCLVQGWKQQPPREDARFPTVQIKVGYAVRSNPGMFRRLQRKQSSHVVTIDFSLNEPRGDPELFDIGDDKSIQIYSFHDLVAEKYRALLQQEVRKRIRRQDVYDLTLLIGRKDFSYKEATKSKIIQSLKVKAEARDLVINKESMRNSEIIRRSREEYELLSNEIEGDLPDFDESYGIVRSYYENLPWD